MGLERHARQPAVLGAVAAGGALGAAARYGLAQLVPLARHTFPWATWLTNVSGSFALGLLVVVLVDRYPPSRFLRPLLATGFLGAYTTYSTFAVQANQLIGEGRAGLAASYVGASLAGGLIAGAVGMVASRRLRRA